MALLAQNGWTNYTRVNKREIFTNRDFITSILRSIPKDGVAVFHEDVQLFSLWEAQLVQKKRPDVSILSTGLSASAWYADMTSRWPVAHAPAVSLRETGGWTRLRDQIAPRPLFVGQDVDLPENAGVALQSAGFLEGTVVPSSVTLTEFCLYRTRVRYGETPDFFSSDLLGDEARAHHRRGFAELQRRNDAAADWYMARAQSLDPTLPRTYSDRGYLAFLRGDYARARVLQERAVRAGEEMLAQAIEFNSLPDVTNGVRSDLSGVALNLGVSYEKLGDLDAARRSYEHAYQVFPNAQAHYNMAVTFWNRDWAQVAYQMQEVLKIDPTNAQAAKYLAVARAKGGV